MISEQTISLIFPVFAAAAVAFGIWFSLRFIAPRAMEEPAVARRATTPFGGSRLEDEVQDALGRADDQTVMVLRKRIDQLRSRVRHVESTAHSVGEELDRLQRQRSDELIQSSNGGNF